MPNANLNNTIPAAPSGCTNVAFQVDTPTGSVSANVPTLPTFTTGGVANTSQVTLDFEAGDNVTISNPSGGVVKIAASGGGGGGGFGGGEVTFVAPVLSALTQTNFGGSTVVENTPNGIRLRELGTGNNNTLRSLLAVLPTATAHWQVTARIRSNCGSTTAYGALGIVIFDSISTNSLLYGLVAENGPVGCLKMSNPNAYNGTFNIPVAYTPDLWVRLSYDGVNLIFWYSRDGQYWVNMGQGIITNYITTPPDHFGIAINPNNAQVGTMATVLECFSLQAINIA